MQFQVPQNISLEDKIVASLTAFQFGILVLGLGVSFFVFTASSIPSPLNQAIGGIFAIFTLIIALGKFNDQPLYRFARFIISYIFTSKTRVWHKGGAESSVVIPTPQSKSTQQMHVVKKVSHEDIAQLAKVLDSHGTKGLPPKIDSKIAPKP